MKVYFDNDYHQYNARINSLIEDEVDPREIIDEQTQYGNDEYYEIESIPDFSITKINNHDIVKGDPEIEIPDSSVSDGKGNTLTTKCDEDLYLHVYLNEKEIGITPATVEINDAYLSDEQPSNEYDIMNETSYYDTSIGGFLPDEEETGKTAVSFDNSTINVELIVKNDPEPFIKNFSRELNSKGFDSEKALKNLENSKNKNTREYV